MSRAVQVAELYLKAADQLGSAKPAVQLVALYALERLAQADPAQRPTVVKMLCGYLRVDVVREPEVQQAAQRILADHLRAPAYWGPLAVDLAGAVLVDADFTACRFGALCLKGARLTGRAEFGEIRTGTKAIFDNARFDADVTFYRSRFDDGAGFVGARFAGRADFQGARFGGYVGFQKAGFGAAATFDRVRFGSRSSFTDARFTHGAGFRQTEFVGRASFLRTRFDGQVGFDGAHFVNGADFRKTQFVNSVPAEVIQFVGNT